MCSTHSTTAKPDAELCDEMPQDHSWHICLRGEEEYSNLQVGQAAKGIFCTHEEETLLSWTLERMKDERVPKKLLVCAPEHGKRTAGGQRLRWSDVVTRGLKRCGLKESWRERAHDRDSWRQDIAKKA